MTTIDQQFTPQYRVEIRAGVVRIGETDPTRDQAAAKEQHLNLKAVYPQSKLNMSLDGEHWREASDDELDRAAAVSAALALVDIQRRGLPIVSWVLNDYQPGRLGGQAVTRDQVEAYADLFGVQVTERPSGSQLHIEASGVHKGAQVRVYCYVAVDHPQEAGQVAEVSA